MVVLVATAMVAVIVIIRKVVATGEQILVPVLAHVVADSGTGSGMEAAVVGRGSGLSINDSRNGSSSSLRQPLT